MYENRKNCKMLCKLIQLCKPTRGRRVSGLQAMEKMIKAHRNHPSIFAYSLCNEGECDMHGQDTPGKPGSGKRNQTVYAMFRNLTKKLDPTRAISANMYVALALAPRDADLCPHIFYVGGV